MQGKASLVYSQGPRKINPGKKKKKNPAKLVSKSREKNHLFITCRRRPIKERIRFAGLCTRNIKTNKQEIKLANPKLEANQQDR
uniref:Uncharacterized protein n=1 Tax=Rhizophora mucronata TaxID=61149 RepID=A0A2P2JUC8_RHIMU